MKETEVLHKTSDMLDIQDIKPHWFDRDTHQLNSETEISSVR